MADFDLRADPAAMQTVGNVVSEHAGALKKEAQNLVTIVEHLKSVWQDEANIIFVNGAEEYLIILKAIINAIENHGTFITRSGVRIGGVVNDLKGRMSRLANL